MSSAKWDKDITQERDRHRDGDRETGKLRDYDRIRHREKGFKCQRLVRTTAHKTTTISLLDVTQPVHLDLTAAASTYTRSSRLASQHGWGCEGLTRSHP